MYRLQIEYLAFRKSLEEYAFSNSNTKVAYKISNWVPVPTTAKNKDEFGGCLNTSPSMDFHPTSLSSSLALEYLKCKMKIVRLTNKNSLLKYSSCKIINKK